MSFAARRATPIRFLDGKGGSACAHESSSGLVLPLILAACSGVRDPSCDECVNLGPNERWCSGRDRYRIATGVRREGVCERVFQCANAENRSPCEEANGGAETTVPVSGRL